MSSAGVFTPRLIVAAAAIVDLRAEISKNDPGDSRLDPKCRGA
jgi:hypothetical protein